MQCAVIKTYFCLTNLVSGTFVRSYSMLCSTGLAIGIGNRVIRIDEYILAVLGAHRDTLFEIHKWLCSVRCTITCNELLDTPGARILTDRSFSLSLALPGS